MFSRAVLALLGLGIAVPLVAAACLGNSGGPQARTSSDGAEGIPSVASSWNTNWAKRSIDLEELRAGIPRDDPRDAIPPIDAPQFETVAEAGDWLAEREPVLLFQTRGEARAYPLQILTWHEVVNDEVNGVPVAITFCPLCNTGLVFDRTVQGQVLRFGTSGLLRSSDLVMWDDKTESLWQQITGEAIVGDLTGATLEFLPSS
ncbi:MAG: DUF3179 domain-containing (seleno)protein, partial [Dehalococcoidia bacterium]